MGDVIGYDLVKKRIRIFRPDSGIPIDFLATKAGAVSETNLLLVDVSDSYRLREIAEIIAATHGFQIKVFDWRQTNGFQWAFQFIKPS